MNEVTSATHAAKASAQRQTSNLTKIGKLDWSRFRKLLLLSRIIILYYNTKICWDASKVYIPDGLQVSLMQILVGLENFENLIITLRMEIVL